MTSSTHSIILETPSFRVADRVPGARQPSPLRTEAQPAATARRGLSLVQYHADFTHIVGRAGDAAEQALLLSSAESSRNPFFHGGCALVSEVTGSKTEEEVLYATSNLLQPSSSAQMPVILISRVILRRDAGRLSSVEWSKLRPPPIMPMPAGVLAYRQAAGGGEPAATAATAATSTSTTKDATGVLYCAQGSPGPGTSGLFFMPRGKPPQALVTGYYGRDFNSVHDVARAADGALWFTDPCGGFEQDFRKKPQLPCHVYRFDPAPSSLSPSPSSLSSSSLRVVDDSLRRPTGLCFSPDGRTLYVSDTDSVHGDGNLDATRAATIYAFDILRRNGSEFLANRRVFAFALRGVPMTVRCDPAGNVYAGCADGVEVWNAGGVLLGVIEVPGGVCSFCLSSDGGELYLCAEQQLWYLRVKPSRVEMSRWGSSSSTMDVGPGNNFI